MGNNFDAKSLSDLFDDVFGVRERESEQRLSSPLLSNPKILSVISEATDEVLATLTPREEKVIKMLYGLGNNGVTHTLAEVGQHFAVTRPRIRQIEAKALRRLRHPSRAKKLAELLSQIYDAREHSKPNIEELKFVVETIKKLTPDLITHLQQNTEDLIKLNPYVFEHLIAEFFASWGFDVRLVGQNKNTSADIYAAKIQDSIGVEQRYFIEVKRWKHKVGIEVIEQVLGAMFLEKEKFGWHAGLIVTVGGFKDFERWDKQQLKLKGIELKDKDDLLKNLKNYKRNSSGLYLPCPRKDI